jgi:hypothetical protein
MTVTAFTLAHSITLSSLATLGVVHAPGPPVEASIALSIMLLAYEIVRLKRGQVSLTAQWPWVVAFSFGSLAWIACGASALDDRPCRPPRPSPSFFRSRARRVNNQNAVCRMRNRHPRLKHMPKDDGVIDEIKALEDRRYRAMLAGDAAALDDK